MKSKKINSHTVAYIVVILLLLLSLNGILFGDESLMQGVHLKTDILYSSFVLPSGISLH